MVRKYRKIWASSAISEHAYGFGAFREIYFRFGSALFSVVVRMPLFIAPSSVSGLDFVDKPAVRVRSDLHSNPVGSPSHEKSRSLLIYLLPANANSDAPLTLHGGAQHASVKYLSRLEKLAGLVPSSWSVVSARPRLGCRCDQRFSTGSMRSAPMLGEVFQELACKLSSKSLAYLSYSASRALK